MRQGQQARIAAWLPQSPAPLYPAASPLASLPTEQKLALLDCLFAIASDEMISNVEDNEISRICSELQISHDEFVSVRLAYREHRAVLKKPPRLAE